MTHAVAVQLLAHLCRARDRHYSEPLDLAVDDCRKTALPRRVPRRAGDAAGVG